VTAYIQLYMKFRYDKGYTPFLFNTGDIAFLNLYQGYRILGIYNKKLAQQWIEFFRMIRPVSFLIYEFEFSNNINIHSVISIIYLELISKDSDFYNRSRNDYSVSVEKNP
jgi:hypothetical protein